MSSTQEVQSLDQLDYSLGFPKLAVIAATICCLVFSFLAVYPVGSKVGGLIRDQLKKVPGCRLDFSEMDFGYLLPKVILKDVQVPASCLGKMGNPVSLEHLTLNFRGPSFGPIGLAFGVETALKGQPLEFLLAIGVGEQVINMQDQIIPLDSLGELLPIKMQGKLKVNTKVTLNNNELSEFKLVAESTNLTLPTQTWNDLKLPVLPVKDFLLKVDTPKPNQITVEDLTIGSKDAPIRAHFKGKIDVRKGSMAFSPVDLKGEAAFSTAFLESFPILNLMLPQFTQKDGFYQIRLGGTLGQMQPSSL